MIKTLVRSSNEDIRFRFWVKDSTGTAKNLTGYSGQMKIKEKADSASTIIDASSYITITAASGLVNIAIPWSGNVDKLSAGNYVYDIRLVNAASTVYDTIINGTLRIIEGVTT